MVSRRGSFAASPLESPAGTADLVGIDLDKSFDRGQGACADLDLDDPAERDLMYPVSKFDHEQIAQAKALCAMCPVLAACRTAGTTEPYGIWGGVTEWERRALRTAQKRAAQAGEVAA